MGQLDNKVTLVTGGSTGIGLAIARRFAAEGATVYLTGRRRAELDAAVEAVGDQAVGVQGDVSKLDDLDLLFATIEARSGRLDVVVANAGVGEYARLGDITEENYDRTSGINGKGTLFTVQKALPLLPDGSSVILLSSSAALQGVPGLSVYGATKAAIRSFARTWAAELASRGIRVNALTPGPIATPGGDLARAAMAQAPQQENGPVVAIPLGRVGHPDEVAAAALFLASDQSSFTTGAELFIDGGITQI
ncbi:SDR family NAD(P)-dependent oxidoreductase [Streptomyces sp. NBC_01794]|uniref:SDR family NAD(P)-dependent oxidoreductase n=1 Tax=Streptomyces sp. NBC_01794 TaxID=2975942 RepID=UPI00308C2C87|nr:glucose 1-dehydrogenase [Streptomyces sp. NBC_01794]